MSPRRFFALIVVVLSMFVLVPAGRVLAEPVQPDFSPSNFVPGAPIDNPFFPLVPGTTFRYEGTATDPEDNSTSHNVETDFVTFQTKVVGGVVARVVHNQVHTDGDLAEDTFDYYAQDKSGNVWYLGEDTKEFELDDEGNIIGTDTTGSWHAGVHGALPGFIMPVNHTIGFEYVQENAPTDQAIDRATNVSTTEKITVPVGTFMNVLKVLEESDLEPGVTEFKFYASGVGNILAHEDIQPDGKPLNVLPLVSVTHSGPQVIPLPPAAWTGLGTMALMALAKGARTLRRRVAL
jgi:hypothetical protein